MVNIKEIPLKIKESSREIQGKLIDLYDKLSPRTRIAAGASVILISGFAAGEVLYGGAQEQRPPGITARASTLRPSESTGTITISAEPSPSTSISPTPTEIVTPETELDILDNKLNLYVIATSGYILGIYNENIPLDSYYGEDSTYYGDQQTLLIQLNPSGNDSDVHMYRLTATAEVNPETNEFDVNAASSINVSKQVGPYIGGTHTDEGFILTRDIELPKSWKLNTTEKVGNTVVQRTLILDRDSTQLQRKTFEDAFEKMQDLTQDAKNGVIYK